MAYYTVTTGGSDRQWPTSASELAKELGMKENEEVTTTAETNVSESDAGKTWATKEYLERRLRVDIDEADAQLQRYGVADAYFRAAGVEQTVQALRWVWAKQELSVILARVRAARFDFVPDLGRELQAVHRQVGFDAWFERHQQESSARLERDVFDAVRCCGSSLGSAPRGDGADLLAWRALSEGEKRELVGRWWSTSWYGRKELRLARGAQWPTSTFDEVPWACGHVLRGQDGRAAPATCTELASVSHTEHSDGEKRRRDVVTPDVEENADAPLAKHAAAATALVNKIVYGQQERGRDMIIRDMIIAEINGMHPGVIATPSGATETVRRTITTRDIAPLADVALTDQGCEPAQTFEALVAAGDREIAGASLVAIQTRTLLESLDDAWRNAGDDARACTGVWFVDGHGVACGFPSGHYGPCRA